MSVGYVAIQWNRHKRIYDLVIAVTLILYLGMFVFVGKLIYRGVHAISDEVLALRALGSCAFIMLTIVLCIGPLARLDPRWLVLLYNRRHLGVTTFVVAMLHGLLATGYYHGFGEISPLLSLLTTNTNFTSLRAFPFQLLGAAALLILFLMAATSHDFWNRNLSPRIWKRLHMLVYAAYGLVVLHVALGALQADRSWWFGAALLLCVGTVSLLHLLAGRREYRRDEGEPLASSNDGDWVEAGRIEDLAEGRGRTVSAQRSERIAVFHHEDGFSALTNVCAHQGGPLGEGKIIGGCVTCPWHGWQYRPHDGQAPPPFTEKVPTHRVRIEGGRMLVDPCPLAAGTPVPPAGSEGTHHA